VAAGVRRTVDLSARSDAELVLLSQAGDRASFGELYGRYADRIHAFALRLTNNRHDAADVTQATFEAAAYRIGQLRQPDRVGAWLYAIARHAAYRHHRRGARCVPHAELPDAASADRSDALDGALDAERHAVLVREAAAVLVGRDRCVVAMEVNQATAGQVARSLDTSVKHAYVLVHRAHARLRAAVLGLLLARRPQHCAGLDELLARWDGRYTVRVHREVSRHMRHCAGCVETAQSRLSAFVTA
jgi:RNA polymerase sigma factor (sigma-70 family)